MPNCKGFRDKSKCILAQEFIHLLTDENISFIESKNFYTETLLLFQSLKENKLSFIDVSLLHLSGKYEVRTFDKDLKKVLIKKISLLTNNRINFPKQKSARR